jgi:phage terminase small subunit
MGQKLKVLPGGGKKAHARRAARAILRKPPLPLPEAERDAWLMFAKWIKDPCEADRVLLRSVSLTYVRTQELAADIREHGLTYETVTPQGCTMVRPRPQVQMLERAERELLVLMDRLGLIPAERTAAPEPAATDSAEEEFTDALD